MANRPTIQSIPPQDSAGMYSLLQSMKQTIEYLDKQVVELSGATPATATTVDPTLLLPTGVIQVYAATAAPNGWVRVNGRTIGNAASGATERANADTEALFKLLWSSYSNTVCPVSGGRGASAAADYAANKTIGLPDLRGRTLLGSDAMGNSAAGRITSVADTNGNSGGTELVTLAQNQLPNATLTLTGTTNTTGAHSHTSSDALNVGFTGSPGALVNGGGSNFRSITTDTQGNHSHTVSGTTSSINGGVTQQAVNKLPPVFVTTFIIKL